MSKREVRVEQLTIRVPGINQNEGHNLGKGVAAQLSTGFSCKKSIRNTDELNVRVTIPGKISHEQMITVISEAILRELM